MAIRIVGVDIPQNKCGEVSLTYIYGIGRSSAKKILAEAGIDPSIKVENWTDDLVTVVYVTVSVFPFVDRAPRTTPARARDVRKLLQIRRRQQSKITVSIIKIYQVLWQRKLLQLRSA